jgi:membrane protein implicated in regulation of membrane protease activity
VGRPDLVHAVQSAFVHGMSLMLLVSAVMSAVLAIVAATVLRRGSTARHRARRGQQAVINERQSVYAGR